MQIPVGSNTKSDDDRIGRAVELLYLEINHIANRAVYEGYLICCAGDGEVDSIIGVDVD
jgi:hypothetical protein